MRRPLPCSLVLALALALPAALPLAHASPATGLPRLAPTVLPAPEPASVAELDQALKLLTSPRPGDHEAGMARLHDGGEKLLPAIARRLSELKRTIDKEQIGIYITEARKGRKKDKDDEHDERPKKKKKGAPPPPPPTEDTGWLPLVLAHPHSDQPYRDLVAVLSLERALVDIGTTAAARELINVYTQYGDLLRIDVQQMMARLGDRAVPALLEARKHDSEKVRKWAIRQLDAIGKAVPGETVQIPDQDVLADVLRAYGRTRDIDALRVVVSFCSSDRQLVRDAAREALVNYGDAALWQLREAHETLTGKRPTASVPWNKLALDLFEAHDRARLEEIFHTFEEGQAFQKDGKLDDMAARYDAVLARAPTFDRRAEMVEGYELLAKQLERSDRPRAALLARKALRLDPQGPHARPLEVYLLTLETEQLADEGLVDTSPLRRALELDPQAQRPRDLLARLEASPQARTHGGYRYLAAAVIGALALVASLLLALRRPAPPAPPPAEPPPTEPPAEPST